LGPLFFRHIFTAFKTACHCQFYQARNTDGLTFPRSRPEVPRSAKYISHHIYTLQNRLPFQSSYDPALSNVISDLIPSCSITHCQVPRNTDGLTFPRSRPEVPRSAKYISHHIYTGPIWKLSMAAPTRTHNFMDNLPNWASINVMTNILC
jgi:hypothetical protein